MYNEQIEQLISAALADGVLTEKEKQVLFKKAQSMGIDLDEFEMVLDARLVELEKAEKEKAAKSAPKSNKLGDVRKCPQCGALIGSFHMTCPECGFEFSNVGLNSYVELFATKLAEATKIEEKPRTSRDVFWFGDLPDKRNEEKIIQKEAKFVNNYPLPMTKEDCVEMLNYILPRLSISDSNAATFAWKKKFNAIIQKMERESNNNQQFKAIIDSYKEQSKFNFISLFILWYKSLSKKVRLLLWAAIMYIVFFAIIGHYCF